jgi:hypothetical protein|tara:strand:+ start:180 stop:572 length:393 start_codon:yes stop_codon:yes gene_type:complete
MPKLNLITPPDKLFNDNVDILLIHPSEYVKKEAQETFKTITHDINVYLYELTETQDYDWLLSVAKSAKIVILDCDNCTPETKKLESYFIGKGNVFWLTKGEVSLYTLLSTKQIYNLDWLQGELNNYESTE